MNYKEFASKIKAIYPAYKNMDDMELARKVVDRYPEEYSDVVFDEPSPIWGGVAGYDKRTPIPNGEMQPEAEGQAQVKPELLPSVARNVDKYFRQPMRSTLATVEALPSLAEGADIEQRLGSYADRYQTLANRGNEDLNIAEQVATDPVSFVSAPAKVLQAGQLAPKFARFAMTPAIESGAQMGANMALNDGEADATGMAVGAGLGAALPKFGRFLQGRAKGQLFGSIVGNRVARLGRNPITPDNLESEFLAKNNIPIMSSEAGAFKSMENTTLDELDRKGKIRENIENTVDAEIPLLKYDFNKQGEVILGAISDAKNRVQSAMDNMTIDPDTGLMMLRELDRQDMAFNKVYRSKVADLSGASRLVTALNKKAKTWISTNGEGTPKSDAMREIATAINDRIGELSPEHRAISKSMGVNMAQLKPISERSVASTVQQPRSGFAALPIISDIYNLETTLSRRPQGAQLKYNIGKSARNGLIGQARRFAIPISNAISQGDK